MAIYEYETSPFAFEYSQYETRPFEYEIWPPLCADRYIFPSLLPPPPPPSSFRVSEIGEDIDAIEDINPHLTLVSGPQNLAQAIARRFITEEAFIRDVTGDGVAGDYGWDLRALCNGATTEAEMSAAVTHVEEQCRRDPRVQAAKATLIFTPENGTLQVDIELETAAGPVSLSLAVDELTVALLDGDEAA